MNKTNLKGKKIYYSGSIRGVVETDKQFPWKLVEYMKSQGAIVLSEHVAAVTMKELDALFEQNIHPNLRPLLGTPNAAKAIRTQDMNWVDEADVLVAVINAPSHGVGMEIERALYKPSRGFNKTPILCLVHNSVKKISNMLKGVSDNESDAFKLVQYSDLASAISAVENFVGSYSSQDDL